MINLRLAWAQAHEIHGTPWEAMCLTKGLDPSSATADDVLGPVSRTGLWDATGNRVLEYRDETDIIETLVEPEVVVYDDPRKFVEEVTEIAGLTRGESRLVYAIVDGAPIPDGKDYTAPLAKRFRTTPAAIRKRWSNAKRKLRDTWAAE
jgi:hypothetical protein